MAILRAGYAALALQLQEAADSGDSLSAGDIQTRLRDCLNDCFRGSGTWAYYIDHFGDAQTGKVIYSCDGDTKRASYTITETEGAAKCVIDTATAEDVVPHVVYELEADEAKRKNKVESGGGNPSKESAVPSASGKLKLTESAVTLDTIRLLEAKADYEIKLIAPGKGSSAFYPAEVLKRDGPKVFQSGTHVYLNHPTSAEEAARPEGDVANLAGVLTTSAEYKEAHAKGPGLYARMKVFADHAQTVEEKAPFVGMSIRASGIAESNRRESGLPVLKELTAAESVDVVTRAGAGGMILTEAANSTGIATTGNMSVPIIYIPTQEASNMDANELKLLRESLAANEQRTVVLLEKELRREAIAEGAKLLQDISLPASAKEYVIETVLRGELPKKDGALDMAKFAESVNAEAKRFGSAIGQGARVTGMGTAAPQPTAEDQTRVAEAAKLTESQYVDTFASIFGGSEEGKKMAIHAVKGRAA